MSAGKHLHSWMSRRAARPLGVLAAAWGLIGCDLVEEAAELTFGAGNIPRVTLEVDWPDADEMSGLDPADTEDLTGFPESFEHGTLAHLVGGLSATGECRKIADFDPGEENSQVIAVRMQLTACTRDDRCADACGPYFRGMLVEMAVDLELVNEAQIESLKRQLEDVTSDAIRQIRLQFHELELYQGQGDEREVINDYFEAFTYRVRNADGDELLLIEQRHLDKINPQTPQRFDLDSRSVFTEKLKRSIIAGSPTFLTLVQNMRVPQHHLYDLHLTGAGVFQDLQPELVISVLDVAASKL